MLVHICPGLCLICSLCLSPKTVAATAKAKGTWKGLRTAMKLSRQAQTEVGPSASALTSKPSRSHRETEQIRKTLKHGGDPPSETANDANITALISDQRTLGDRPGRGHRVDAHRLRHR
ncbi:60S ribosomal protein L12 [Fukomys damarensis]|uniref:60S ribosomal protein L12 n=1 Tax=Fukomys damarensis TaxID=885580 RepID=A0A091CJY9_FUKDA|nr:60S ribosomal protein L12 [Fukomys damarensis]